MTETPVAPTNDDKQLEMPMKILLRSTAVALVAAGVSLTAIAAPSDTPETTSGSSPCADHSTDSSPASFLPPQRSISRTASSA